MIWSAVEPSQPPSVLVLDDGPAATAALADNGFAVTEVQTGEEAMHLLHERPFDLILLDMNPPGWNSLEGCSQIRKFAPGSKIIMLAAVDADEDRIRALEAGADDCVNKPLRLRELVARARALLRHPSPQLAGTRIRTERLNARHLKLSHESGTAVAQTVVRTVFSSSKKTTLKAMEVRFFSTRALKAMVARLGIPVVLLLAFYDPIRGQQGPSAA